MTPTAIRRTWLVVLWLYALVAAFDLAAHLNANRRAGREWFSAPIVTVAFSRSLFWPLDLVAHQLLAR